MPRQREFDPDKALHTAIDLFWEKGYHDSSVDELVKRSGVAKYGLYGTFGTKRELFIKALSQFAKDRHKDILSPVRKPNASLPDVHAFFKQLPKQVERITRENARRRGCLMCNTAIELGSRDAEIGDIVRSFFQDITNVMEQCLARGVAQGQLAKSTNITAMATYLVTEFRAVLMLAASGHSRRDMERHLELALTVLK